MPPSRLQAADLLRQRQEAAKRGEKLRPLAASGLPDASAAFGGPPETTINPFVGGDSSAPSGRLAPLLGSDEAEDSREVRVDPSSGVQGSSGGFSTAIRAGEGHAGNAAQAAQMLRTGQFENEAHKARLQEIVTVSQETEQTNARLASKDDAAERKRQQGLLDFQWKQLVQAGANPNNPMSTGEFDQAAAEIQRNALAGSMPNPNQLRKRNEEADDPALDVTNTSKAWSEQFGIDAEKIGSFFGQPANGKFYTQSEKKSAWDMARQAADKDPSTGQVNAVGKQLTRVDNQIVEFKKQSTRLFDENGGLNPSPTLGSFFSSDASDQAAIDAYNAEKEQFDKLVATQTLYADQLQRYAGAEVPDVPQPTPTPPPAGLDTPGSVGQTEQVGLSPLKPLVLPKGVSEEVQTQAIAAAKRQSAANKNAIVYVNVDGTVYEIQAE